MMPSAEAELWVKVEQVDTGKDGEDTDSDETFFTSEMMIAICVVVGIVVVCSLGKLFYDKINKSNSVYARDIEIEKMRRMIYV